MKKEKATGTATKPGKVKAKRETARPIPRRAEKAPRKPAKGKAAEREVERTKEIVRKASPLAAALLGFLESVGMRPTAVVRLETEKPERKKPTARKAEGPKAKKVRRLSELAEGLGFDKAGMKRLEKAVREKVAKMKAVK